MTSGAGGLILPGPVEGLLSGSVPAEEGAAVLRAANLLDTEGLGRLLDMAEELVHSDPGKAHRLAELCATGAAGGGLPAIAARSAYVRLQTHFARGEFDAALRMAREAYEGYLASDMALDAVRTHVGRMSVLLELGLYQEALDAGQTVLDTLDGRGDVTVYPSTHQRDMLTALVQQNLGGCLEYMGRYEEALAAYSVAESLYGELGETERVGEILDNRGAVLLYLGRGTEALGAHEAAARVFAGANLTLPYATALCNIGEANRQLADYRSSLIAFEEAHRIYQNLDALKDESQLVLDTANVYLDLNLYPEALAAYQRSSNLLRRTGMAHDCARALWGMGVTLALTSNFEEAERSLSEAAELFSAAGNSTFLSGVMLGQSLVQEKRGDPEASLAHAERALELVLERDWSVQRVYAHLRMVDVLLPDVDGAERHLMQARLLSERLALPQLRQRLNERLGRLRRLQGSEEEALVALEEAVDEIERLRDTVTHESMRASFLLDKIGAYEELLKVHLHRWAESDPRGVFAVAERAKSRGLVDLLTGVSRRGALPADEPLQERIMSLQSDLNATYNQMLGVGEVPPQVPLPDLHGRTIELEREISELRLRTVPLTSDPFTTAAPPEVWEELPPDVTLVAYHIMEDEIIAFVGGRDRVRVVRGCGSAGVVAKLLRQLDVQWDRMGADPGFVGKHTEHLTRLTERVLASLYDELVASLEPLPGAPSAGGHDPQKITIIPHGMLHRVPFHALFDGEAYLLDRFEVSYAPSATVFTLCQRQEPRDQESALVLSVRDPLIPHVSGEALAVASHLPGAELLADGQATVDAVRERAPGCDVLHLASHGMFRGDNPMFSSLKLHDGWLTAADVLALDLDGALVTLSACESARNRVLAGDEIVGLARGFLGAGAATLVASLWLVQDETTSWMMEGWYARMREGAGRTTALREAQLALRERHPHPYYWAPFVLMGRR
ncbi:MAG TPA: CHAT domain-containing tetratricopeptide repeat protein [Rubrobacter sp.]|nr:CHAT domain-containing tetratricopeptide repeat protein [Rubrobacter sp.]